MEAIVEALFAERTGAARHGEDVEEAGKGTSRFILSETRPRGPRDSPSALPERHI